MKCPNYDNKDFIDIFDDLKNNLKTLTETSDFEERASIESNILDSLGELQVMCVEVNNYCNDAYDKINELKRRH